jgi:hypothetical protein
LGKGISEEESNCAGWEGAEAEVAVRAAFDTLQPENRVAGSAAAMLAARAEWANSRRVRRKLEAAPGFRPLDLILSAGKTF